METIDPNFPKNRTTIVELIKSNSSISPKQHKFYINNNEKNKIYNHRNNMIVQTKYNAFSFLPKGIIIQFFRFVNIYFLVVAIIQIIPILSPLSSSTALVPLVFVILVSLVREGIEDHRRHKFDNQLNSEPAMKFQENKWTNVHSGRLKIGDITIIKENQFLPADIILLDSNFADGMCYVETATLDGEKTLKPKIPNIETVNIFKEDQINYKSVIHIEGECISDLPCPDLYRFNGYVKLAGVSNLPEKANIEFGIDNKQLILKGM